MTTDIIKIENVSFKYKGSEAGLLNNISLSVEKGKTLLLCGASGCGKTTIIRLINGLIPHYYQGELEGDITVCGKKTRDTELYDLAGTVGTVFQNPRSQFFSVDTDGEIVFGPENIGLAPEEIRKREDQIVSEMNIGKLMGRSLFELSGGEKQKIACASVSTLLPEVILLDEPSSNLDWNAIEDLRESIRRWKAQGKTIVISEHRLWYLKDLIDRVLYLEKGVICREWNSEEFGLLTEDQVKELKLRPISLEEDLIEHFRNDNVEQNDSIRSETDIVLKDFYFSYNRKPYLFMKKKYSAKDADLLNLNIPELRIPAGSVTAVTGNNGTGKSTFLRCVCGLEKDCPGKIILDGHEYKGKERLKLSYLVMQDVNHQLFTDSVMAEVMLSNDAGDEEKCTEIIRDLGILEYKDKHPMALSGGQKQRVAIASAIAASAKIFLFDEPTSGLAYAHMEVVASLLKELAAKGAAVLVSTHDPELIKMCCDHILRITDGKAKISRYNRKIQ